MKRIVLCADDYALTAGVSAGIRQLIGSKRLSATSVMTTGLDFPAGVAALLDLIDKRSDLSIGLHVTLTGALPPASGPARWSTSLGSLARDAVSGQANQSAIETEIVAQFDRFVVAFGRPPDHVDGHQHVHLLPGIRKSVLNATARFAPRAWVRTCAVSALPFSVKAALLAISSLGMRGAMESRGLRGNTDFGGTRSFAANEDVASLFASAFRRAADSAVIMCHPGHADADLHAVDPVTTAREAELAYLESSAFGTFLEANGIALTPTPLLESKG